MEKHTESLIPQGWIRALIFLVILLALNLLFGYAVEGMGFLDTPEAPGDDRPPMTSSIIMIMTAFSLLSIGLVLLFRKFLDKKDILSMGLKWNGYQPDGLSGLCVALFILSIGSFILFINGNLDWVEVSLDSSALISFIGMMAVLAISEELVFRGYVLNNLLQSFEKWMSLFISAALFTIFHLNNPSVSVLAVVGLFCGGIILGLNYIYTKNLWFSIFFHFAWNMYQGPILGYEVSGLDMNPLLEQDLNGDVIVTGGEFGFEASIISIVLLLISTMIIFFVYERKNKPARVRKRK